MFKEIDGGSCIEIQDNAFGFIYKCWIPPFGYGQNAYTGEIKKTDVITRSEIPEECFWERQPVPKWYLLKRADEKKVQAIDIFYVDPELEEFRSQEWHRRMYGVWFANYNPITKELIYEYITGLHWLYITHWKFQGKHLDFRIEDKKLFYVAAYWMEDDKCLGGNEITKRKIGKTARVGCWGYERISRMNNHHGGLQSKTDTDAESAFKKAIIHPWQKLPHYFRPRYDLMKGEEPQELRFFATARRGSKAEEEDNNTEDPLDSFFDYMPSTESAYDGPELHTYISDEAGKTKKPVSIIERQNVTRFCTEIDFEIKGKHWYTTTVEPEKGEPENYEFWDLTAASNPLEKDENGFTGTGLYTYFLPAQKGMYANKEYAKYGYVDEEMNLRLISNKISALKEKNDTRGISSFKRKNPTSLKEAFSADGEFALYNPEVLNNQLDNISWTTKFTERGNLKWKDGYSVKRPTGEKDRDGNDIYEPSEVYWEADPTGKYEKVTGWFPKEPNKVVFTGSGYKPNNVGRHGCGCDPFRYDKTKDKRRSNCAAFGYQIADPVYPDNYDDYFTIRYAYREESTRMANEDVLKMAWWLGCEVLFERNVNHWKNDFGDWECAAFLTWLPEEVEPGIITRTSGTTSTVQVICNYTEAYINQHINKVFFKTLIRKDTGWLGFKIEETEDFDEPMGAGITLIQVKGITNRRKISSNVSIYDFFPKRTA
jgi:hypothetical protein